MSVTFTPLVEEPAPEPATRQSSRPIAAWRLCMRCLYMDLYENPTGRCCTKLALFLLQLFLLPFIFSGLPYWTSFRMFVIVEICFALVWVCTLLYDSLHDRPTFERIGWAISPLFIALTLFVVFAKYGRGSFQSNVYESGGWEFARLIGTSIVVGYGIAACVIMLFVAVPTAIVERCRATRDVMQRETTPPIVPTPPTESADTSVSEAEDSHPADHENTDLEIATQPATQPTTAADAANSRVEAVSSEL